jgi:hypothetical protein
VAASTPLPNPRRVAAGKRNRQKRRGLTAGGRERLRQAALAGRPWLHATGPKTAAGKARVAQNGRGRQAGEPSARAVRRQLGGLGNLAADMAALRRLAQRPHRGGELTREGGSPC